MDRPGEGLVATSLLHAAAVLASGPTSLAVHCLTPAVPGAWDCFAWHLSQNRTLTALDLRWTRCDSTGAGRLAAALAAHPQLQTVNLSCSFLDDAAMTALSEALAASALRDLSLCENPFTSTGFEALTWAVQRSKLLEKLDLSRCQLAHCYKGLSTLLATSSLTTLLVAKTGLQQAGSSHLLQSLKRNRYLTSLDISENRLVPEAQQVAELLSSNKTITELNLKDTQVNFEGAKNIAKALARSVLRSLTLDHNPITSKGALEIVRALQRPNELEKLSLSSTGITDADMTSMCFTLGNNKSLSELDVSYNLGVRSMSSVAQLLLSNGTLASLNFTACGIVPCDADAMLKALRRAGGLQCLNLSANFACNEVAMRIRKLLEESPIVLSLTGAELNDEQSRGAWSPVELRFKMLSGRLLSTLELPGTATVSEVWSALESSVEEEFQHCRLQVVLPDGRLMHRVEQGATIGSILGIS